MKRVLAFTLLIVLSLSVITACASENSMEDIPKGNLISTTDSPEGTYRFNAYLCSEKGQMYVRGEIVTVESNEARNIYWAAYSETLNIEWTNDTTIVVNETSLDVLNDAYDCRNEQ